MARFVYWMNVSLDLMIEADQNENGGGDWIRIDEELHTFFNDQAKELTMSVEGRVIYEVMEEFWPAARTDSAQPAFLQEYGHIWTDTPKILLSRTRTEARYNTQIVSDHAIQYLADLRNSADGKIGVGGANVATQILQAGLLDELLIFTHPVIVGRGRPLFDSHPGQVDLELLEQRSFSNGVTMHRYDIRYSK